MTTTAKGGGGGSLSRENDSFDGVCKIYRHTFPSGHSTAFLIRSSELSSLQVKTLVNVCVHIHKPYEKTVKMSKYRRRGNILKGKYFHYTQSFLLWSILLLLLLFFSHPVAGISCI